MTRAYRSPKVHSLLGTLKDSWDLRRVWWFTATSRTRARFARTILGSFWLGLSNLLSIAVLALVYGTVFKVSDFRSYVVYLGIGLVLWNSIASAISSAPNLFEHNSRHLHNTNINPVFYPLEEWSFQIQTFAQSLLLVLLSLSLLSPSLIPNFFLFGILPLLNLILFLFWLPLIVCLLGARYRDVYQLVPIVLQLVFLLSPILYEKKNLGPLSWTAEINPLYLLISPFRHALIDGTLHIGLILAIFTANVLGLLLSVHLLNKERPHLPFLI